jgi:hypothetical protein
VLGTKYVHFAKLIEKRTVEVRPPENDRDQIGDPDGVPAKARLHVNSEEKELEALNSLEAHTLQALLPSRY